MVCHDCVAIIIHGLCGFGVRDGLLLDWGLAFFFDREIGNSLPDCFDVHDLRSSVGGCDLVWHKFVGPLAAFGFANGFAVSAS